MRSVWDLHHQHKILPVQIVIRGQGSSRNPVLLMSGYSVLNARPRLTLRKSMISRRSLAPSPPPDDREKLRDLLCFEQEGVGTVLRCSLAVDFPLESRQHDDLRPRSEEHTSELQSRPHLVCRLLLEKKKITPACSLRGE